MDLLHTMLDHLRHLDVHLNHLADWNLPVFYAALFLTIFAETGLVVTPFLPGDSLLFALGALAASATTTLSLPLLFVLLVVAAVVGDAVNYAIGWRVGPKVFRYENSGLLSRLLNKKHLFRAQEFYETYGSKTIILARFVPIVRTFAPFVAGIGTMQYRRFAIYNIVGGLAWVAICLFSGYFFGQIAWVKDNFELVVIAIIVISVLPMAFEFFLARRRTAGDKNLVTPSEPTIRAGSVSDGHARRSEPKASATVTPDDPVSAALSNQD